MQTNIREGIHARLSEFYGKSGEDVTAWYEEVERVATVNNWKVVRIYTIIAAYLKEATTNYYKKEYANINS